MRDTSKQQAATWARPWMVHSLGWILVFPALTVINLAYSLIFSFIDAAEQTRVEISRIEFGGDDQ